MQAYLRLAGHGSDRGVDLQHSVGGEKNKLLPWKLPGSFQVDSSQAKSRPSCLQLQLDEGLLRHYEDVDLRCVLLGFPVICEAGERLHERRPMASRTQTLSPLFFVG